MACPPFFKRDRGFGNGGRVTVADVAILESQVSRRLELVARNSKNHQILESRFQAESCARTPELSGENPTYLLEKQWDKRKASRWLIGLCCRRNAAE